MSGQNWIIGGPDGGARRFAKECAAKTRNAKRITRVKNRRTVGCENRIGREDPGWTESVRRNWNARIGVRNFTGVAAYPIQSRHPILSENVPSDWAFVCSDVGFRREAVYPSQIGFLRDLSDPAVNSEKRVQLKPELRSFPTYACMSESITSYPTCFVRPSDIRYHALHPAAAHARLARLRLPGFRLVVTRFICICLFRFRLICADR